MAIDAAVPCMGMVYTSPYEPEAEVQYLRGVDGKLDFQWQTMIDPNHATTKPFHESRILHTKPGHGAKPSKAQPSQATPATPCLWRIPGNPAGP